MMIALIYCLFIVLLPLVLMAALFSIHFRPVVKPLIVLLVLAVLANLPGFWVTGLFSIYAVGEDMYAYSASENILRGLEGSGMVVLALLPCWLFYALFDIRRNVHLAS